MNSDKVKSLISAFATDAAVERWQPFGHGHINDTYLVTTLGDGAPNLILQRKNHTIFKDIPGMAANIAAVTGHIRKKLTDAGEHDVDRRVMTCIPARNGHYFVNDSDGNFWMLFLFVQGSHSIQEVTGTAQAFGTGRAFGRFQLQLADLPATALVETIPSFHNSDFRLHQLIEAIVNNRATGRVSAMSRQINWLLDQVGKITLIQQWIDAGEIPLRITHNDTKINNILFDSDGQPLCIIDLDTVMPGSVLFDFGDAIRTIGNTAAEDEPNLERIQFNIDNYRAFADGYLSEARSFLTPKEIENLPCACLYMVWEQAVRFLTDYLNGDIYYKTGYPEHNRIRTLAQIHYLKVLNSNFGIMTEVLEQNRHQ